jgi:hypothetical protein
MVAVVAGDPELTRDGGACLDPCFRSVEPDRSASKSGLRSCASCPLGSNVIGTSLPVRDNLYQAQSCQRSSLSQ